MVTRKEVAKAIDAVADRLEKGIPKLMAVDFDKKSIPCPMFDGPRKECVCGLYDVCENQPCRILARRKR